MIALLCIELVSLDVSFLMVIDCASAYCLLCLIDLWGVRSRDWRIAAYFIRCGLARQIQTHLTLLFWMLWYLQLIIHVHPCPNGDLQLRYFIYTFWCTDYICL